MNKQTEALKLALDYIVVTNKSSEFWLIPASNLNKTVTAIKEALQSNEQEEPTEVRLWDSQWINVVNHDNCYQGWDKEDAINHAVKMTEKYIASNFAENTHPPVPTAQPKQEKNFCQRCGKQLGKNDWDIHTCTPPQPKELEQKPVAVMELYTDGWDLVEGIDTDWLETLPFGTRLFSHPPVTTAQPEPEQEPASGLTPKGYFIKGWDARGVLEDLKGSVVTDAAMRQYMTEIPDTTPPQRTWAGLTDDDIRQLEKENTVGGYYGDYCPTWDLIEATEAKLKEKNT